MKFGRYELPLGEIIAFQARTGWRAWWRPGFDALLRNGKTLHFTAAEKQVYDEELATHQATMQVYAMCKGLGLRG